MLMPIEDSPEDEEEAKYANVDIIQMMEEHKSPEVDPSAPPPFEQPKIKPMRKQKKDAPPEIKLPPNLYPDHPKYSGRVTAFRMEELIGTGNFTQIFRAVEKETGVSWAVKVANKKKLIQIRKEDDLKVEKHCLNKLKGVEEVVQIKETFQDFENLYLVMELLDGPELWDLCKTFGMLDKRLVYHYFLAILRGVKKMHDRGIVHRDLKPENIKLQNQKKSVKIIDFGTAKDEVENYQGKGNSSTGRKYYLNFVGTAQFMAPECVHDQGSYKASDVYSLGCIFYNMIVGFTPFVGGSDYLIFKSAHENRPCYYPALFSDFDVSIVERCLEEKHEKRPSVEELI